MDTSKPTTPDLAAQTEARYDAYYHAADTAQWRFALAMLLVPLLLFAWFDYRMCDGAMFFWFVVARVLIAVHTVWLIARLRRPYAGRRIERLQLPWAIVGVAALALNALGRPRDYFGHYIFEVFALMLFFAAMPMRPLAQRLVGLVYLAVALPVLFFFKQPPTPIYLVNTLAVMLLTVIAGCLIGARMRRDRLRALEAQIRLEYLARTDSLTGIANRRAFLDAARLELGRAAREQSPLAVLMLDIDHFKKINDRYGHDVGDVLLEAFARRIEAGLRNYDRFARLGGEEFAVLLPGCPQPLAVATAERLRLAIAATPFPVRGSEINMTVSIGVADVALTDSSIDGALSRADAALYAAKHHGRNRVEALAPLPLTAPVAATRQDAGGAGGNTNATPHTHDGALAAAMS